MYRRILVPVDGSAISHRGLAEAVGLARASGATLKLVHVISEFVDSSFGAGMYYETAVMDLRSAGQRILEDEASYARDRNVSTETEMIETTAVRAAGIIVETAKAWSADLIAMGTHGRRGLSRLALGSDAEQVLRSAPVPLLMVSDAM